MYIVHFKLPTLAPKSQTLFASVWVHTIVPWKSKRWIQKDYVKPVHERCVIALYRVCKYEYIIILVYTIRCESEWPRPVVMRASCSCNKAVFGLLWPHSYKTERTTHRYENMYLSSRYTSSLLLIFRRHRCL